MCAWTALTCLKKSYNFRAATKANNGIKLQGNKEHEWKDKINSRTSTQCSCPTDETQFNNYSPIRLFMRLNVRFPCHFVWGNKTCSPSIVLLIVCLKFRVLQRKKKDCVTIRQRQSFKESTALQITQTEGAAVLKCAGPLPNTVVSVVVWLWASNSNSIALCNIL